VFLHPDDSFPLVAGIVLPIPILMIIDQGVGCISFVIALLVFNETVGAISLHAHV
jgi:hypothetical protein